MKAVIKAAVKFLSDEPLDRQDIVILASMVICPLVIVIMLILLAT